MKTKLHSPLRTSHFALGLALLSTLCAQPSTVLAQVGPGSALSFDGVDDFVSIGAAPLPTPWTAEFWVNRQDAFDDSAILLGGTNTTLKLEQWQYTRRVGFTQLGVADYLFNYTAPTGTWVHLTFVGTTDTKLYVNGALQDVNPATISLALDQIGGDIANRYNNHVRGAIDEVRVWNVARSQADIQANMYRSLSLPQPNLVAYWRFDEGTGDSAYDASGNGWTGTLINGPAWVPSTAPFVPGVATLPASQIGTTSATLNGLVNPNGAAATAWFQWGADTNYGYVTASASLGSGTTAVNFSNLLSGLTSGASYHFRAAVSNSVGLCYGADAVFSTAPPTANGPGYALSFEGVDDFVSIGAAPLPTPWTAEFWVNRQDASDYAATLLSDAATALRLEQFNFTRRVGFTQFGVNDYLFNYTAPVGTWVHLAFVGSSTDTKLYVNGVLQDTQPQSIALGLAQLGAAGAGGDHLRGTIAEVRVWSLARSQSNIQSNMYRGLVGNEAGLVAYWRFNEGSGSTVSNTAAGLLTGTLENGVAWVPSTIPFVPDVTTLAASAITSTGATLNASITPNSLSTTAWFRWGTSTSYGNVTPPVSLGSGTAAVTLTNGLTGLTPSWTYHFCAMASNTAGIASGADLAFMTQPPSMTSRTNVWVSGADGKWENGAGWSQGTPQSTDFMCVTNAGTKAVTLDSTTASFPGTMVVKSLTVGSPSAGESNTVALNFSGTLTPLSVRQDLSLLSGGRLMVDGAALVVSNLQAAAMGSLFIFNSGQITLSNSVVSNGVPFAVGAGAAAAVLNLPSGEDSFANGLVIASNGTLVAGCVRLDGPLLNKGTLVGNCPGGLLALTGTVTNNGTIVASNGCVVTFYGPVVNHGTIRADSRGGDLRFLSTLLNDGTINYPVQTNYALAGTASQSSTALYADAARAIDGNTDGNFADGSVSQTAGGENPAWWQVDFGSMKAIGGISIWFRTDCCPHQADSFKLVVQDGSGNVAWQQQYAGRPPANVTYNLPTPVWGQIVRIESSGNPGGQLGLAEAQVFAPYQSASILLTQDVQPVVTVGINNAATIGPVGSTALGVPQNQLTYQWQKDGADIPGATLPSLLTPPVGLADNGSTYRCRLSVPGLTITSGQATLTVIADQMLPQIVDITFATVATSDSSSVNTLRARVDFDKQIDPITATDLRNYAFSEGMVSSVALGPNQQSVILTVVGIAPPQTPYSLAVANVADLSTNTILSVTNVGIIPFYAINHALTGTASQSSTGSGAGAERAIDGNTDGNFYDSSVTLNAYPENPGWWEVDLGATKAIGQVHVWFRTDCCNGLPGSSGAARNDNFTLKVLDATRTVIRANTYPGTPPADVFYNIAPALQGRYVRFESQTPITTSDGFFSLAEVQVFAPCTNVAILEMVSSATNQSLVTDLTVEENHTATLGPVRALVEGPSQDQLTFQWQRDGIDIAGATRAYYTTPPLVLTEGGSNYRCKFILPRYSITGREWSVNVVPDVTPPSVQSIGFDDLGDTNLVKVMVKFDELMNPSGLLNVSNYQFSGGNLVSNLTANSDGASVSFVVSGLAASGGAYSLTVRPVSDLKGNLINATPTFSGKVAFSYTNLVLGGVASQSSVALGAGPERAIDGNTDGNFYNGSVTLNAAPERAAWWEVNLGAQKYIGRVHLWFRSDSCTNGQDNFTLKVLDTNRVVVWQRAYPAHPLTDVAFNIIPPVQGQFVRFETAQPPINNGAFSLMEVQVFAPYATSIPKPVAAVLHFTSTQTNLTLSWAGTAIVQRAASLLGPWTNVYSGTDAWRVATSSGFREAYYRAQFIDHPPVIHTAFSIDNIDPEESFYPDTVNVRFTLKNNYVGQSGFVSGYVTRGGGAHPEFACYCCEGGPWPEPANHGRVTAYKLASELFLSILATDSCAIHGHCHCRVFHP